MVAEVARVKRCSEGGDEHKPELLHSGPARSRSAAWRARPTRDGEAGGVVDLRHRSAFRPPHAASRHGGAPRRRVVTRSHPSWPVAVLVMLIASSCTHTRSHVPAPGRTSRGPTSVVPSGTGCPVSPKPAASAPGPRAYLDAALDIVETKALYADRVDWCRARTEAVAASTGAKTASDTYAAIEHVLGLLGDHHSRLANPQQVEDSKDGVMLDGPPSGGALSARVGYLRVPQFNGPPASAGAGGYVAAAERVLAAGRDACGWVVDLRGNPGGNLVPMLLALRPLLGDGDALRVLYGDRTVRTFQVADGLLRFGDDSVAGPRSGMAPFRPSRPVAVLVDGMSASSAEDIMIAFRGRALTRSFGTPTLGLTTTNEQFPLADRALLVLTVGVAQDVANRTYDGPIAPDERIEAPASAPTTAEGDPVVGAARHWLGTTRHCS